MHRANEYGAASAISRWRREPFRFFFPLGVLLAWIGIGHWILYDAGIISTYSCFLHGLVQLQAVMMAFAAGVLLTELPRCTQTVPPSAPALILLIAALITVTAAAEYERWLLAESAYGGMCAVLLLFTLPRVVRAGASSLSDLAACSDPTGAGHRNDADRRS